MQPGQRVIFSDNGVISDITISVNDFDEYSITPGIVAAQDKIYIASAMPFNHRWIEVGTVNTTSATIGVEIWNSGQWQAAADVIDYTSFAGATFGRSGIIQFRPNIENNGWTRQRLSSEVTGIAALEIYEMYWMRLTFSANPLAGMTLKYIGQRFSRDIDLFAEYPDLNNTSLMTAWQSGKTSWDDQHVLASDYIVQKLISANIIFDKSQIMDWQLFKPAAVHKTAEIIYGGFGPSMAENRKAARESFDKAINLKYFNVDKSGDGDLSDHEKMQTTQEMSR
jgi:hypothetical protein